MTPDHLKGMDAIADRLRKDVSALRLYACEIPEDSPLRQMTFDAASKIEQAYYDLAAVIQVVEVTK